ncbi:hypothetical protein DH09_14315 [Bacillaceae bacterium JMAK1]|nr:hypothetical protein DH09_14315 [Bacillaceae bacterium JMAK1]
MIIRKFISFVLSGVLLVTLFKPSPIHAQSEPHVDAHVTGTGGAVASEDFHASKAGMTILDQGGNAIDAAIAVAAAQGVTRPYSGGIGGGGMMLIYLAEEDRHITIDARSVTPASFNDESYIDPTTGSLYPAAMRTSSGTSVSVPGTIKNWEVALEQYGTMSIEDVLQPAIQVAENGFIADHNFVRETNQHQDRFNLFSSTVAIYDQPRVGERIKNPDLAHTYRLIANEGADVFYEGEVAEAMVQTINEPPLVANPNFRAVSSNWNAEQGILKGDVSLNDFKGYEVITREATHSTYRGYDIYGMPPSSSGGITVGLLFNILEGYDVPNMGPVDALHHYLEASRAAFADRRAYIGDPTFTDVPENELLSMSYADHRRSLIHSTNARIGQIAPGNPQTETSPQFPYNFQGVNDGQTWPSEEFHRIDTGPSSHPFDATFTVNNEQGQMTLSPRQDGRGSSYGRAAVTMESLADHELTMRVYGEPSSGDRRLRIWLNADVWQSGSTLPLNGYGLELNFGTNQLALQTVVDGQLRTVERIPFSFQDEWHDVTFRIENEQLKVAVSAENEGRTNQWLAVHSLDSSNQTSLEKGNVLLSMINFDHHHAQTFYVDHIDVKPINEARQMSIQEDVNQKAISPAEKASFEEPEEVEHLEDDADESTIHLSVSDDEGNIVSYTSTIVSIGGNGMVVPGYGFLLNNAVYSRIPTESPDHPNYPRAGMRSLSSMSPTIVMEDNRPVLTIGAPGSDTIITTVSQIMMHMLDFNQSFPEAIAEPRFSQRNNFDSVTEYEGRYVNEESLDQVAELETRGHRFLANQAVQGIGAVTGIEFHENGQVTPTTESERRGGGSAMVQHTTPSFSDVHENTFGYDSIMRMAGQSVITGYTDGTFRPSHPINRGQSARILTNALELPVPENVDSTPFVDTPPGHTYADVAAAVYEAGIMIGSNNSQYFKGGDYLTRQQMASILVRGLGLENTGEAVTIVDLDQTYDAHRENVKILTQHGITITEDNRFRPNENVTRAQLVVFLDRALD